MPRWARGGYAGHDYAASIETADLHAWVLVLRGFIEPADDQIERWSHWPWNGEFENLNSRQIAVLKVVQGLFFSLPEREKLMVMMRFGILDFSGQPKNLEQVAEVLGVTRERVRQMEQKRLAKLRWDFRAALSADQLRDFGW